MNKILSFLLALFFAPLCSAVADVSCPSGYTKVAEDVVYISSDNTCPSGHTKLGGEYGADTILNCTTAQSGTPSICTYFAEQCQSGMYFDGTRYQTCPSGSYCDGTGTATPGLAGCSQTCPSNSSSQSGTTSATDCICNDGYYMNNGVCEICPAGYACSGGKKTRCEYGTYADTGQSTCSSCPAAVDLFDGKAMINSTGEATTDFRDIDGDGVYTSINECGVMYYMDDVHGMVYAFCTYNVSSEIYDKNCFGYPIGCAAGRYADEENAEYIAESYYPVTKISSDKISDYTSLLCSPVGENYWSPGVLVDYSNILDTLKRYSCPGNSSTNGSVTAASCTCNDGYTLTGTIGGNVQTTIDVCRPIPEFTIITTDMSANTEFSFKISAAGIYTIDWGDGNVESIVKTDTNNTTYSHIYETAGVRTIGIGGDATEYNGSDYAPAISFEKNKNIAKLVGSLGSIFSGSATSMFHGTFNQCTSLTEIPKNLFDGVSGSALGMFAYTFSNCTSLTEIPSELFDGVSGGAESMFMYTFANCKSLTEIPEGLFNGITDNASNQFYATFMSSSSLEMIPSGLFKNITGKPVENEFMGTFYGCVKLSGYVPIDMFKKMDNTSYVSGPMSAIFYGTNIAEQCPENMYQYKTGFEVDWSGKVACSPCPDGYITDGPGATDISQCYIPCEKQCVRQTCPDNALNCTHGTEVITGKQYYGETCNAKEIACTISFTCPDGYTKSGLAQWAINNMDLLIDSETVLPMCGLDGLGSCDELKPGEWESYYEDGLPIKSATGVAVCNSVPGDDSTFDARINKDADFDLNTTGNYCWMKVQTVNDSFLPASWVYGWQYDTPEQCADDCGWSHNDNFQTVELAIVWGAEYDTCIANEYTVTYDCNGGTGNTTDTVTYNTTFTPRTDVCERDGHQFLGWTLNGASVSDSFVWNTTDNQTLVATWKQLSAECASGEYLPANTATCVPCKENNYCPGGKYDVSDTDTGINPCPENSSSQSGTTYCTCYDGYTVSGSVDGVTQTTTTACKFVPEFSITTVQMSVGQEFKFGLTAAGTFYIDCGTGGTPIGATTVLGNVGTIVRNSARNDGLYDTYSCRYDTAGSHTIRMSGNATAYTTHFTNSRYDEESMATVGAYYKGAIYFGSNKLIKEIHGSLGQIFSTLDNGAQPSFHLAFEGQSNMVGQIPAELFSGVHGEPIAGMFAALFDDCSKLQGPIPKDLFKDINGKPAPGLFANTFGGCSSLQGPIPSDLFVNIKGEPAPHMFAWTFGDCTNLSGSIDRNLFSGISGDAAEGMFFGTFYNCSNLTGGIDQDLFKNIVGAPQPYMFAQTFFGCEQLSGRLPGSLFKGINGAPAEAMYVGTFAFCSSLDGNIPETLFGTIDGAAAPNMYYGVFMDDRNLDGEIPVGLFGNISGKPQYDSFGDAFSGCSSLTGSVPIDMFKNMDNTSYVSGPMYGMFNDTGLVTQCPENMYQYKTGFEVDWSGRVACTPCPDGYITDGPGATDVSQCYMPCQKQCVPQTCPDNATCTHGAVTSTTGKQYYGGTCNAEQTMCGIDITCDTGYNKTDSGIEIVEKTPLIPVDYHESGDDYAYVNASGDLGGGSSDFYNSINITELNTWASHFDYGTVYGRASCQPSMDPGIEYSYMNLDGILSGDISLSEYETNMTAISGAIKAKYITNLVAEMLAGTKTYADLSLVLWTMLGTGYDINYNANSTGDVCYCQMTEFVSASDIKHVIEDAPWVWFDVVRYNKGCPSICAQYCAVYLKSSNDFYEGFRAATFGAFDVQTKATCEIAIIDIPAGYYLPANTTEPVQCPENNYCPGVTGAMFNKTENQGINSCPNDGISPAGSIDITQCYIIKPCGQYTDITTTCYYNTESNDYTNCAECAVDSSCPYNQELVNGKCAPCNRDNAIKYHETGNCMVSECEPGYQPYMQQCMPDKISCDAPNAEIAYKYWGIESRAYGPCIISKCVSGYNIEANACVPDVQPCTLEHGTGTKTYNHDTGTWGKCIASECEPGYTTDSMLTDDVLDGQCGRCSNMFVDNDLAVSTYVSGCEIATCMYQGEKYILENNECRMICSELHDDTGDRYWNGKKCVQKCKDGYSMW